jgi:ubiquinol-cytochrome c reductase cytochrome b subunit
MVAAILFLLGGLVQINPIYQWGPFEPWLSTNGAQPDWFLGWLIGGLRLMPPLEPRFWGHTWIPNPFWGGAAFPLVCFGILYAWPWVEQRFLTRDRRQHDLLDRPRDNPTRTAIGAAFFSWVFFIFFAGSADRVLVSVGISYVGQVWVFRFLAFLIPIAVGIATRRICIALRDGGGHPWRHWTGRTIRRNERGGFEVLAETVRSADAGEEDPSPSSLGTDPTEPSRLKDGRFR